MLRRKLARVPLDLDYPYWIEDRDFDLDHHVRHLTLPAPGDWRALWDLAARLHAYAVDLRRPPWELYFIDGVDGVDGYPPGSFAMLIKIHHCAIDGISGIELMNALHDLDPDGRGRVVDTWRGEDADPEPLALLAMARRRRRADARAGPSSSSPAPCRPCDVRLDGPPARMPRPAPSPPATRLNQRVTTNRVGDAHRRRPRRGQAGARRRCPAPPSTTSLLAVVGGGLRAVPRRQRRPA